MEDIVVSLFICLIIPIGMSLLVLKDRSRVLMIFFLSGLFMCLFAGQINGLILATTKLDQFTLSITITPVVEEILKSIPILVFSFIIKPQRQFIIECALMVGIGFSVLENGYVLFTNNMPGAAERPVTMYTDYYGDNACSTNPMLSAPYVTQLHIIDHINSSDFGGSCFENISVTVDEDGKPTFSKAA